MVGALQYVTITRPEISFSVNKLSQFMQSPLNSHWNAVKRILQYLKGTLNYGLLLHRAAKLDIIGYSDANWANDADKRSMTGLCVFLGPNLVSWTSKQ